MILAPVSSCSMDDELGLSSTHTRDAPPAKPLSSSRTNGNDDDTLALKSKKKSVSFRNGPDTVIHVPQLLSSDELHARWYSPQEYQQFRYLRVKCVRKLLRSSPVYTHVVEQAHGICCQHSSIWDSLEILEETEQQADDTTTSTSSRMMMILNESEMKQLSHIYRKATFVGLERVSVKNIALDKQSRRSHLAQSVRQLQQVHARPEVIRQVCERISQPSKVFAKHIAVAQAAW